MKLSIFLDYTLYKTDIVIVLNSSLPRRPLLMKSLLQKIFQKRKKVSIEFCERNLDQFLDEESMALFQEFFNEGQVTMKEYSCLSQCELCKENPYAKINGEIIKAENSKELIRQLKGWVN